MPNPVQTKLPDFRNFGVLLRCLILAEALHLLAILVIAPSLAKAIDAFMLQGILFEPVLLTSLLALFLLSPGLQAVKYLSGVGVVLGVVVLALYACQAFFLELMPRPHGMQWGQSLVSALSLTGAVLFYFNWRHLKLSPGLTEARLLALQARIRPHFLFNSLNSVLSLMRDDPKRAETMLENLSDLFRAVLSDSRSLVPLAQEIELAKSYLAIESIRLGGRLQLDWQCQSAPMDALIPPLVLQPLLENAVMHGIAPRVEGGVITIKAFKGAGNLNLIVSNPLPVGAASFEGNHMALQNIKDRLELHYDVEAQLKIVESTDAFEVHLRIPL